MVFDGRRPDYEELVDEIVSRLHLVPRYRQRLAFVPLNQGRPVWVDDPHFNVALPRPPHRAAAARAASSSSSASPAGSSRRRSTAAGRCGSCGSSRASPTTASRCCRRPITRSSTASRASTSRPCCSTRRPTRCRSRRPSTSGSRARCRAARSCSPTRCSSARPSRPRSSAASRATLRGPRHVARRAGQAVGGVGAMARAGLERRAVEPVQRPDRPASPLHLGPREPATSSRRSRTPLGGTVNDVVLAVGRGRARALPAAARRADRRRRS